MTFEPIGTEHLTDSTPQAPPPHATERQDRSIAAAVTEIDELKTARDSALRECADWKRRADEPEAVNQALRHGLDQANADYADLKAELEELGEVPGAIQLQRSRIITLEKELATEYETADALREDNAQLRAENTVLREALEDIDTLRDVALGGEMRSRPVRHRQPAPARGENPLAALLTSPTTRKLAGQLFKAVTQSFTGDELRAHTSVDGRAGDDAGTSQSTLPSPARRPRASSLLDQIRARAAADQPAPDVDLASPDPSGAGQEGAS